MSDPLIIYPSGFAGSSQVPLTPGRTPEQIARSLMSRQVNIHPQEIPASEQVRELMATLQAGGLPINAYDFADRTIRLALDLFSRTSSQGGWHDWILAQHEHGHMGPQHRNWIDETVNFIVLNKPRRIRANTWTSLINASNDDRISHPVTQEVRDILRTRPVSSQSLTDWVWHWCMAPSGVYDLAQSLQVIYGPR